MNYNTSPQAVLVENGNIEEEEESKVFSFNYSDPFLKGNRSIIPKEDKKEEKKEKRRLNRIVRWPHIQYNGMVASKKKDSKLGMLTIGNRDYLVRKGHVNNEILVLDIYPDSIGLEYSNDKKYFYIKNNPQYQSKR